MGFMASNPRNSDLKFLVQIYFNYYNFVFAKGTKSIATRNVSWPQNALAAWAAPRTPLGELTALAPAA